MSMETIRPLPWFQRYGLAVLAALLAIGLRMALTPWLDPYAPYVTVFPLVILAALLWGHGPGLVAAVIGHGAANVLFVQPSLQFHLTPPAFVSFGLLLGCAAFLGHIGSQQRALAVRLKAEAEAARAAEAALHASEERLRRAAAFDEAALKSLGEGLYTIDENGLVTSMNPAAEELFGWTFAELRGKKMHDMTHHHYRDGRPFPACECAGFQVLTHGRPLKNHEDVFIRKDGAFFDVTYSIAPLRDAAGQILGLIVVFRDITDRKQAEAALREADRRKDEFLAMLAHELRNPLAPISNAVVILKRPSCSEPDAHKAREMIERQVRHLTRLVDELLDATRIARGKVLLRTERLDLSGIVRQTAEDYRSLLEASWLALAVELPVGPVWVEGDPTRLEQILCNLLDNARKFTDPGGAVTVALSVAPDTANAVLAVRDSGIGIAPDMLQRVFETFSQADRSLDRSRGGLGLGLALVKGLAELHGGRVEAESAGLGQGAEFRLQLPLATVPWGPGVSVSLPPVLAPRSASDQKCSRILLIEDNRDTAESLKILLEIEGYAVEMAHTGPAGLEAMHHHHPDVLLCDVGLPGMNGYEVARAVRRSPAFAHTYLVATGYGRAEERREAELAGFNLHLTKPVSVERLTTLLACIDR